MPVKDGNTAAAEIREMCNTFELEQPYIVEVTGHTEQEYIKKAWKSHIDEIVSKPVKLGILEEILMECVRIID